MRTESELPPFPGDAAAPPESAVRTASRSRRLGVMSEEYLLILALVVIPIALLSPMLLKMVATYASRVFVLIRMPLG
jgi:hypothetical protein